MIAAKNMNFRSEDQSTLATLHVQLESVLSLTWAGQVLMASKNPYHTHTVATSSASLGCTAVRLESTRGSASPSTFEGKHPVRLLGYTKCAIHVIDENDHQHVCSLLQSYCQHVAFTEWSGSWGWNLHLQIQPTLKGTNNHLIHTLIYTESSTALALSRL